MSKDTQALLTMLETTEVFKDEEIRIAEELLEDYLNTQNPTDYRFYSYESENGKIDGFACFGATHISKGTYDFFWLVVDPKKQRSGIGIELMIFIEEIIRKEQGRLIIVETSSVELYKPARKFYEKNGYQLLARIKDYYNIDDDLIIYGKYL